jgi:tetratricopeptide (TPR) repeat protein
MSAGRTRLLLITGAGLLTVLLFIAPRIAPGEKVQEKTNVSSDASLSVYAEMAAKSLDPSVKIRHNSHLKAKRYDSLAVLWDSRRRPDLGAFYFEQLAIASGRPGDWFTAGNRYYNSVRFCQDESEIPVLYQSAVRSFRKGLGKDPGNTDARIMLATCYVEGSDNPMEGITMLREIEKTDGNNVKLQMSFAAFSMKSGQLDKAIQRFRKVLEVDSSHIEAYLHLADAYEQKGNRDSTIAMLQEFAGRTPDITARVEVNRYIEQLRNKK